MSTRPATQLQTPRQSHEASWRKTSVSRNARRALARPAYPGSSPVEVVLSVASRREVKIPDGDLHPGHRRLSVHVLHGDLHHNNVLLDATRGWLAIDPKGLFGERVYDVANLICNPWPHGRVVLDPKRALRCAEIYGRRLCLYPRRIMAFATAHAGLASSWAIVEGGDPGHWLSCVQVFGTLF